MEARQAATDVASSGPAGTNAAINASTPSAPASPAIIATPVVTMAEIQATGNLLPELKMELHVFSSSPTERFVFINSAKYREGETLPEGPRLEAITEEGAILSYREQSFLHGFRPADLSGELARYRSDSGFGPQQTLPHGIARPSRPQQPSPYQPDSRLANLCRFGPGPDPRSPGFVCRRRFCRSNWTRPSTPSIPPPSICVFPCFPGPASTAAEEPSNSTPCWICAATSPPSSRSPRPSFTTSTYSTISSPNRAPSTSWTGAISILRAFMCSTCAVAFFIIRARKRFKFRRLYSHPVDKTTGLKCDQTVVLTSFYPAKKYPQQLRRIRYYDSDTQKNFTFLTNNFSLPALAVTQLYRCRWQVETLLQMDQAAPAYQSLLRDLPQRRQDPDLDCHFRLCARRHPQKKRLQLPLSLYTILQILSLTVFEENSINSSTYELRLHNRTGGPS